MIETPDYFYWEPPIRMLVDLMVYGELSRRQSGIDDAMDWVCDEECSRWLAQEYARNMARALGGRADLGEESDVNERCRYHQHDEHGRPCYLER